jgi:diguanylate cyclase (GGDEF)-like protein
MNDKIIKSVIEITRQRDMDSLELSLVSTLADIVPVNVITLYKSIQKSSDDNVEEVLRLSVSENNQTEKNYAWSSEKHIVNDNHYVHQCFRSASIISSATDNGYTRILYPVFLDHKVSRVLSLESREILTPWNTLIEAIITIYNNYLTILNESERDRLTGLFNRRTFDFKLDKLLKVQREKQAAYETASSTSEQRHLEPLSSSWLAMLDIDNFKNINDNYGHLFGDEVLLTLSQIIKRDFRYSDLLFRFGGEEFVVILEPTSPEMATRVFERFSQTVAGHNFPQVGKTTISIGFARLKETDYPNSILERADKALYYAKQNGKNCVHSYDVLVANGKLSEKQATGSTVLF